MAGANLFGVINAVLTCVVLGIVATRGGDTTNGVVLARRHPTPSPPRLRDEIQCGEIEVTAASAR